MENMASTLKNTDVCRTCLAKETKLLSVFDLRWGTVTLDYVVDFITGIKIELEDGLPIVICIDCKEQAIKAFDFKKKSLEADSKLQKQLRKEKREVKVVEVPVFESETLSGVKIETFLNQGDEEAKDYCVVYDDDFPAENDDYDDKGIVKKESPYHDYNIDTKLLNKSSQKKKKSIKVEMEDSVSTYCPLCGTSYDGAENLTKHMWRYHADLMGPKKRGRPKKLMTSSILSKLSENGFLLKPVTTKPLECIICKDKRNTKEDLALHLIKHKDFKFSCCFVCKKLYLKKKHFDQHTCMNKMSVDGHDTNTMELNYTEVQLGDVIDPNRDMENMNILFICKACGSVFISEEALDIHRESDHPEAALRCSNCSKIFTTEKAASRHKVLCVKIDKRHVCNYCGLRFAYEISLNKHILRHHEGESVSVKFLETRPEERAPAPPEPEDPNAQYQCDTCQRCFPKKQSLEKHTKTHMPIEKCFECEVCNKKFSRKDNLRSHKKIHEPNREKAPNSCLCLYCGRGFSNSSNLIVHMRRHTGEKPYKCDFCGKGFPRSSDLQCHRRSHTGEKPCVCRVCGKGFSRSNKLSRHMRVHTGLKPYKCTYCEKAFSQSNDLTLHVRRHTGDKPYICEVCGDRFIQGSALQTHRRIHGHFQQPTSSTGQQHNSTQTLPQTITYTIQNITQ